MGGHGDRPEHSAPADVYYGAAESAKYTVNTRVREIQTQLTRRALDLLSLDGGGGQGGDGDGAPRLVLDLGCGSGLSGEVIGEQGHVWVGCDLSENMLKIAVERGCDEDGGDVFVRDLGQGLPLRPDTFDAAVSISAIQWLCNADKAGHEPRRRLRCFFESLYRTLVAGGRAALQFYPESEDQLEMITTAANRAGFSGGVVIDYPNSAKAKKFFLVVQAGQQTGRMAFKPGAGLVEIDDLKDDGSRAAARKAERAKGKALRREDARPTRKDKVLKLKERWRKRGADVRPDTKYTARKRKDKF